MAFNVGEDVVGAVQVPLNSRPNQFCGAPYNYIWQMEFKITTCTPHNEPPNCEESARGGYRGAVYAFALILHLLQASRKHRRPSVSNARHRKARGVKNFRCRRTPFMVSRHIPGSGQASFQQVRNNIFLDNSRIKYHAWYREQFSFQPLSTPESSLISSAREKRSIEPSNHFEN